MTPPKLLLRGIEKRFGAVAALRAVDLEVGRGEFVTVLGPSGSGKTTLLHVVAGYEIPDAGAVIVGGEEVTLLSPARRNIGMVFQNFALFPHMTVAENVGFPLRMRRLGRREIRERVEVALELVALGGYGDRRPNQLSGGQQQRVALARALVFEPQLLLLDEPLGALDRKLRDEMQFELRRLQRRLAITTILITHDQEEALVLGDRVAVLRDGTLVQIGTPAEVYARPANAWVAEFVGESTLLPGRLVDRAGEELTVEIPGGLRVVCSSAGALPPEGAVRVLLRPEALKPLGDGQQPRNLVRGEIVERTYAGAASRYRIRVAGGHEILMRLPYSPRAAIAQPGDWIEIGWQPGDCHLLAAA
jgi:spermidine/putrescine ABC transporter ATP-binding subunit